MEDIKENEVAREMQREYFRNWRANNRDKIKEYNSRYWKKRAEKLNSTKNTNKIFK